MRSGSSAPALRGRPAAEAWGRIPFGGFVPVSRGGEGFGALAWWAISFCFTFLALCSPRR
jgi:hypothetical protein